MRMRSERATIGRAMLVVALIALTCAVPRALSRWPGLSALGLTVAVGLLLRILIRGPDRWEYWLAYPTVALLMVIVDAAWCQEVADRFVAAGGFRLPQSIAARDLAERRGTTLPWAAGNGGLLGLAGLAVDRARRRSEPWALLGIVAGWAACAFATVLIFVQHVFGAFD